MVHSEEFINANLAEPHDGTRLVVDQGDNEWHVIWRDDMEAKRWGGHELDRWFHDANEDPMALYQHVKYAEAVYEVGANVIRFAGQDQAAW